MNQLLKQTLTQRKKILQARIEQTTDPYLKDNLQKDLEHTKKQLGETLANTKPARTVKNNKGETQ